MPVVRAEIEVAGIRQRARRGEFECKRRKRLLFVYGENDYLWQEFQEHLKRFGSDRSRLPFELKTIPKANHILTEASWQQALFTSVCDWYSRIAGSQAHRQPA